jgi:nucleotide-binding universal stress UspA family protein
MPIKDILVHIDASPRSATRLNLAFDLATRYAAHLTAVYVIDIPAVPLFYGNPAGLVDVAGIQEMTALWLERARKAAETIEQRFREQLARADLRGDWRQLEGFVASIVAAQARYADLAIVGQRQPGELVSSDGDIPETVMMSSGRPVLVVPYAGDYATVGEHVVVGWKPTREAARAINDALPLLAMAQSVKVVAINPVDENDDSDLAPVEVALHLARHNVKADATYSVVEGVDEGDVLLNAAADMGADLIVVGGYGHSRTRELIFGGVTRSLLANMTVPVLFSH